MPDRTAPHTQSQTSVTEAGTAFVFNFQIPAAAPVEVMETAETLGTSMEEKVEQTSSKVGVTSPPEPLVLSKSKKKKKSKQVVQDTRATEDPEGGGQRGADPELVSIIIMWLFVI